MPPALLPWQVAFLAYAAGIWTLKEPAAGPFALAMIVFCNRLAGRDFPRPALLVLAGLVGLAYAVAVLPAPPQDPPWLDERGRGQLTGQVTRVEDKPGDRLEILLENPSYTLKDSGAKPVPGRLVLTWQDPGPRPAVGDILRAHARPRPTQGYDNPGGPDWAWRWQLQGVFFRAFAMGAGEVQVLEPAPASPLEAWRLGLRQAIVRGAGPGSAGGMVLGLVTGERFAISPADLELVRRASLSHLLAVSGMNLAAVVGLAWVLAWMAGLAWPGLYLRLSRPRLTVLIGLPLTMAYLWLGRFEPSLMRAALMFASWGVLLLLGHTRVFVDGLFIALAAMCLANPLAAFDLGLLLSAAAVAGLVFLLPMLAPWLTRLKALGPAGWLAALVLGWAGVTLAAQAAVLPIQAHVFGEASPHLYLNLLWAPVVEWLAQPPAYVGALLVSWWPGAGEPLLALSAKVCALMLDSLRAMDARGWLDMHPLIRPLWPQMVGFAALLAVLPFLRGLPRPRAAAWVALCLALLAAPALWQALEDSRDRLQLTMLDVGQAQAIVITLPGGERVLVDGGGAASPGFDFGRAVLSPVLTWGRPPSLHTVVMSHPDADHAGGLPYLLAHYRIGSFASHGEEPRGALLAKLRAALDKGRVPARVWKAGDVIDLGKGAVFEVLAPPEGGQGRSNDASLVLRLVWRGRGLAILPGDSGAAALSRLAASGQDIRADVLAVPHHGSKGSLAPLLYQAVRPSWAFISAGRGNSFGLPSPAVTAALEVAAIPMLNTAHAGAITAVWDAPDKPPRVTAKRGPTAP